MLQKENNSSLILLTQIKEASLYQKLIAQLNKDFQLAGLSYEYKSTINPSELVKSINTITYKLITNKFEHFLKLLYIIDVSEKEVTQSNQTDVKELSNKVAYILLKREWQKVYFKNKFNK